MDPEYGQTQEFLRQFPDNKNIFQLPQGDDVMEFDIVLNLNGLKEKSHIVFDGESEDANS